SSKLLDALNFLAIDIFGGHGLCHLAVPVAGRFDAEQVVAGSPIGMPDLMLAPATFECRLPYHELCGNTARKTGFLCVTHHFLLEITSVFRLIAAACRSK